MCETSSCLNLIVTRRSWATRNISWPLDHGHFLPHSLLFTVLPIGVQSCQKRRDDRWVGMVKEAKKQRVAVIGECLSWVLCPSIWNSSASLLPLPCTLLRYNSPPPSSSLSCLCSRRRWRPDAELTPEGHKVWDKHGLSREEEPLHRLWNSSTQKTHHRPLKPPQKTFVVHGNQFRLRGLEEPGRHWLGRTAVLRMVRSGLGGGIAVKRRCGAPSGR